MENVLVLRSDDDVVVAVKRPQTAVYDGIYFFSHFGTVAYSDFAGVRLDGNFTPVDLSQVSPECMRFLESMGQVPNAMLAAGLALSTSQPGETDTGMKFAVINAAGAELLSLIGVRVTV